MKTKSYRKHIDSLGLKQSYLGCYIAAAYSDSMPNCFEYDLQGCYGEGRHLKFILPESIPVAELEPYLMLIGDYNGFNPKKAVTYIRKMFGEEARVFVAREGSVCLYVKPSKNVWISKNKVEADADEISYCNDLNMFRVWWD